jgi:hypothetical protein
MNEPRRIMPLPLGGGELGLPYSRGLMARSLMASGVAGYRAYALASRVGDELIERGLHRIEIERLEALAVEVLGEKEGRDSIQRLRRFQELRELDLPIMVFIGGATGTGKSTVATELAYRFGITRVTSTDFVRQTMRAFFSHDFMPSIHQSSFEAGDVYPDADDPLVSGFMQQARNVLVGVRASSAGRLCSRESTSSPAWSSCRVSTRPSRSLSSSRSATRTSTFPTSTSATKTQNGPSRATSNTSTTSVACRSSSSHARHAPACR